VRVVIAEDLVLLRQGLVALLADAGHDVVAAVGDGEALAAAVAEHRPDLAIVDVRMPPDFRDEGLRAAVGLRREHPETAVLILSQHVEERYASELIAGGTRGVGYLLKDRVADVDEFLAAAVRVAGGGTAIDHEVIQQVATRSVRGGDVRDELTPRERDVLALMAEGHTNLGIAKRLVVTEGAVEKHVSNVFAKLGLPPSDETHRRVSAVLTWLGV
jgi:DNA-binding NarL/FixJ family response regulator